MDTKTLHTGWGGGGGKLGSAVLQLLAFHSISVHCIGTRKLSTIYSTTPRVSQSTGTKLLNIILDVPGVLPKGADVPQKLGTEEGQH